MTEARTTRQDRLRAALRDNLKRRKVQARARAEPGEAAEPASTGEDGAGPARDRTPGDAAS